MREGWGSWTSMLLFLCAQVHCLHMHLEGWRACDCGGRRGQGRVACAALRLLPDPPPQGPENPSPQVPARGGPSRPQQQGLPGSLCGGRVSWHRVAGAPG